MADHIAHRRDVYEQKMGRTSTWQEMGVLQRMAHQPMSPEQISAIREQLKQLEAGGPILDV